MVVVVTDLCDSWALVWDDAEILHMKVSKAAWG